MAYGDTDRIAALVPRHTKSGRFDNTTQPTLLQVEAWNTQVSNLIDASLANHHFTVPITDTEALSVVSVFADQLCADLVQMVNGYGRFKDEPKRGTKNPLWVTIGKDIDAYIEKVAKGLEELGAARQKWANVLPPSVTVDGKDIEPIFQRGYDWVYESDD